MIQIRTIQESDVDGFHAALDAVARERRFLASMEAPPLEAVREFVLNNLKRGVPQLVAVDGRRIVGWIDICIDVKPAFAHKGTLGMGIVKDHRALGIGTLLMKAALQRAQEIGLEKVELEVFESNAAAIALYRKFGFRDEGKKVRASILDGRYENNLIMGMFLDNGDSGLPE